MKLFSRNKETSDPAVIIRNSLSAVVNRISESFEDEKYHWTKPIGEDARDSYHIFSYSDLEYFYEQE